MKVVRLTVPVIVAVCTTFSGIVMSAHAQFPDFAKVLGQLPQILKGLPANKTTDTLGAALGSSANSSNTNTPATEVKGADLLQLLEGGTDQIDLPREQEIGRQLSSVLLGSKHLSTNIALQRYVNSLGRWISSHSTRPDIPWTFAVLDDDGYNAFAAPGGYVFVTQGLIDQVTDEAELAGILAHEISHVTQKHHLKAMQTRVKSGALTQIGANLINSKVKNDTVRGLISDQGLALTRDLYSKGLDRGDEFESDRLGVVLATNAGFDPYGLVSVLQGLRTASLDNPLFALTLSTHPPSQERLDALEGSMGNRLDRFVGAKPSVSLVQRGVRPPKP